MEIIPINKNEIHHCYLVTNLIVCHLLHKGSCSQ